MSRRQRWFIGTAVFIVLAGTSAAPLHGQLAVVVLQLKSPQQLVEIPDDRGRTRLWRFEAHFQKYDSGRTTGGMKLERASELYEFRVTQIDALVEGGEVLRVVFEGRGLKTSGNRSEDFEFTGTVEPAAAGGDILIYDIQDGFVYEKPSFEAEGALTSSGNVR